ncbi:LacI family transcriptional regulator [Nakamurella silvestris]|nr:LacI family transcriptional regulator [Nakamurella silvestris]
MHVQPDPAAVASPAGPKSRPTLRQLAELSGVSIKTASRVLNGEQWVAAETAERVLAAAEQLGFRRNAIARELRAGARSSSVGLIIGDVSNPFYARIARGAERLLRAQGKQLITASTDEDSAVEYSLISDMLDRRVSALMIVTSSSDHSYLEAERQLGVPMIFLDRPAEDLDADTIVLDNRGGTRQAIDHLLAQGHRRIGLVGDLSRLSTHRERIGGFESAMTEAGIQGWDRYLRTESHDLDSAAAAVRDLLALPERPTAIFTANNRITIGAMRALRDLADPPALVGFDDFDLADLLGVTVVAHDPERMGELGAELVTSRLDGDLQPPRRIVLPTHLIARGSGERSVPRD